MKKLWPVLLLYRIAQDSDPPPAVSRKIKTKFIYFHRLCRNMGDKKKQVNRSLTALLTEWEKEEKQKKMALKDVEELAYKAVKQQAQETTQPKLRLKK